MWKYYLDERSIIEAIKTRINHKNSVESAANLLKSFGYTNEVIKKHNFDELIFTEGSLDELYTSEEIKLSETVGKVFTSRNNDIFDFFIIDLEDEKKYDAFYIGSIIKIINKAFRGRNIIIFQCEDSLIFGSRHVSKFLSRDFQFTYWLNNAAKLRTLSAYSICRNNSNYSYAMYLLIVNQLSLFTNRYWNEKGNEVVVLEGNYISLAKELDYIKSKQVDSFELLDKAMQSAEFINTDEKMKEYRSAVADTEWDLSDDDNLLQKYLRN